MLALVKKARTKLIVVFFAGLIAGLLPAAAGMVVDHSIYAALLDKHARNGMVDYAGFKAEEATLDRYLKMLEQVDPESLTRQEQFAFYINAYNAWTIKLILTGYPGVKSIKDLGGLFQSPWSRELVRTHGKILTLDDVEHKILRPRFKDARVHFAINCASKSCPPLLSQPYEGIRLDAQLTRVTRAFINDPLQYRLEGSVLRVSSIFKWFSEDFNHDVLGFYLKYAEGDLRETLESLRERIEIKYLDYDWSLNGA